MLNLKLTNYFFYGDGTGTDGKPYEWYTADELREIESQVDFMNMNNIPIPQNTIYSAIDDATRRQEEREREEQQQNPNGREM